MPDTKPCSECFFGVPAAREAFDRNSGEQMWAVGDELCIAPANHGGIDRIDTPDEGVCASFRARDGR